MLENRFILLWILIFSIHTVFPALVKGTLVKTPNGFIPIECLQVGDLVFSPKNDQLVENHIVAIFPIPLSNLYKINTIKDSFNVSSSQYVYDSLDCKWIVASQINTNTRLLDKNGYEIRCLNCEQMGKNVIAYELLLEDPHTFFITHAEILVHNFAPMIGVTLSWGGKIALESIVFCLGAFGLKLFKDNQQDTKIKVGSIQSLNSSYGGPEDPEKEKHPYGKYEDAPYHHRNSKGMKSPCPKDGQSALDNSLKIEETNSRHRISISNGEFVVLTWTSPGLYHGHVRTWNELTPQMQNTLRNARLVTSGGKIIL